MKNSDFKASATSLGIGSFLMIVTMVLHPVGGNVEAIQRVSLMAIISHGIAILSIPFTYLGFKGLSQYLVKDWFLSQLGMAFFLMCSVAVMSAAALNGLAMPFFVEGLDASTIKNPEILSWIIRFSFKFNKAYDLIFMVLVCLSVLSWSLSMWRQKLMGKGVAVFGLLLGTVGVVMTLTGMVLTNLHDFRLFIFGYVAWAIWVGVALFRSARLPD